LARHFDQGPVTVFGLDANPFTVEFCALHAAGSFELNHQLAALQGYFFSI
jgi:hypothetical protein